MFTELMLNLTGNNSGLGLAQAAAAIALSLAVVLLARRFAVHAERDPILSLVRGMVQMALVGVILALLLVHDVMNTHQRSASRCCEYACLCTMF